MYICPFVRRQSLYIHKYYFEDLHFDAQLIDMHASDDVHDQLESVSV